MGVRTRTFDMIGAIRREAADRAKRDEAARVVDRWNKAIGAGRDMWWSPTIRAAILAGMPWADVHCPGCRTSRSLDLRTIDAKSSLRVLDPMERISEVLFGLIMVLVVTGSISIAADEHAKIRTMLVGALGCNLAWGIIDAGMYLLAQLNERGRAILLARGAAGRRGIEPRGDIGFGWNLDAKGA